MWTVYILAGVYLACASQHWSRHSWRRACHIPQGRFYKSSIVQEGKCLAGLKIIGFFYFITFKTAVPLHIKTWRTAGSSEGQKKTLQAHHSIHSNVAFAESVGDTTVPSKPLGTAHSFLHIVLLQLKGKKISRVQGEVRCSRSCLKEPTDLLNFWKSNFNQDAEFFHCGQTLQQSNDPLIYVLSQGPGHPVNHPEMTYKHLKWI